MKYVICIPDGCADLPVPDLDGRTPLEAALTPNIDELAARATVGRAAVIPDGMSPGSDVGNMSIFGFDPSRFHTGRAPIEVAALGVTLRPDQTAFRCNLVRVVDGVMVDYAGGNPDSAAAASKKSLREAKKLNSVFQKKRSLRLTSWHYPTALKPLASIALPVPVYWMKTISLN